MSRAPKRPSRRLVAVLRSPMTLNQVKKYRLAPHSLWSGTPRMQTHITPFVIHLHGQLLRMTAGLFRKQLEPGSEETDRSLRRARNFKFDTFIHRRDAFVPCQRLPCGAEDCILFEIKRCLMFRCLGDPELYKMPIRAPDR